MISNFKSFLLLNFNNIVEKNNLIFFFCFELLHNTLATDTHVRLTVFFKHECPTCAIVDLVVKKIEQCMFF